MGEVGVGLLMPVAGALSKCFKNLLREEVERREVALGFLQIKSWGSLIQRGYLVRHADKPVIRVESALQGIGALLWRDPAAT